MGELEIPGFSDYLQRIEGEHLLGLGRNADMNTGRSLEPQISLYDVSDLQDPQLTERVPFAESGQVWSDAYVDHHAISYFPEYGVLAIPMSTAEQKRGGQNDLWPFVWDERYELWLFQIDVAADDRPVRVLGRIEHDSVVRRSLRIGATLYSISDDQIQVHPIQDPASLLASIPLGPLVMSDNFRIDSDRVDQPLDVLGNDLLGQDETAQIVQVGPTQHGASVTIAEDGRTLLYTPADGFFGRDRFTYVAAGVEGEDTATVDVYVELTVDEDSSANLLQILASPEVAVPAPARIVSATSIFQETVLEITADGQGLLYSPGPDTYGADVLTLSIEAGDPAQLLQRYVQVFVRDINDPPIARDDHYVLRTPSTDHVLRVLANDTALPDAGERLEIVTVGPTSGGGEVRIDEQGQRLLYNPPTGGADTDSFTYTVADGRGGMDQATVTIELRSSNDGDAMAALAVDDLADRLQISPAVIQVLSIGDVDWPDACLGVPSDAAACAAVMVPGYRILLAHNNAVHVYHTDRDRLVRYAGVDTGDTPLARIRLEAVDSDGNAITSIQSGKSFLLNVYAEDLRRDAQGVYAAYVDILYRDRLLHVDGDVAFGAEFINGRTVRIDTPGLVDEIGAFGGLSPLGAGERVIASIPLVADRAGSAKFTLAEADEVGNELLLYG
ncbi:MAG: beta-propeller domain-containing protein, partial [Planctomycetes bacterium]|nr:beta-propeller domain-containing protein [Planctomycetota bacterium]